MAVFQKNEPALAAQLEPFFDGVIDEQCNEYSECSAFQPYLGAGKPVLNAEYEASLYPSFCAADQAAGMMGALYATALDGKGAHDPRLRAQLVAASAFLIFWYWQRHSRWPKLWASGKHPLSGRDGQTRCRGVETDLYQWTVLLRRHGRTRCGRRRAARNKPPLPESSCARRDAFSNPRGPHQTHPCQAATEGAEATVSEEIDRRRRHGDRHGRRPRGGSRSAQGAAETPIAGELTASSRRRRRAVLDHPHADPGRVGAARLLR